MYGLVVAYSWDKNPIANMETLSGRICIITHKQDEVIPYKESISYGLMQSGSRKTYTTIELDETVEGSPHNREFTEKENALIITEIQRMLQISL